MGMITINGFVSGKTLCFLMWNFISDKMTIQQGNQSEVKDPVVKSDALVQANRC